MMPGSWSSLRKKKQQQKQKTANSVKTSMRKDGKFLPVSDLTSIMIVNVYGPAIAK